MTTQYTPVYGIAYCDTSTALNGLAAVTESAAETIEAALAAGNITPSQQITDLINAGWFTDTGWLNITPASGFAVGGLGARYKVRGGWCYLQAHLTATSWAANSTLFILPASARPKYQHWCASSIGHVDVSPSTGVVRSTDAGSSSLGLSTTFPVI